MTGVGLIQSSEGLKSQTGYRRKRNSACGWQHGSCPRGSSLLTCLIDL